MKKIVISLSLILMASCAQEKIGYIDNIELMNEYQEKIDVEKKYEQKASVLAKRRDSISQAFQAEAIAFEKKAKKMSQSKAQKQYAEIQQRGQYIGQQLQQLDKQLQSEGQQAMDSIVNKVKKEIQEYGKANGYTYILGGGDGGSVLYGKPGSEVTHEIVKVLNQKYNK